MKLFGLTGARIAAALEIPVGVPHDPPHDPDQSMASQESIQTEASDLPTGGRDAPDASRPSPSSGPGSSGAEPSTAPDWGLEIGVAFPSASNPKYHIKAEIDDGGMGIVYEAHQGELGVVAIKVIKPRILSESASERFLNEARAMGKLRSEPSIATIFDCDFYIDPATGTRAPYIVMEYIPGAAPITAYANEHRLGHRARLELFQKVCEAVAAAHRADIIHRDLKPANIMVGASGQPKVIDFGLAVVRDPTEHAKRLPSERGGLFGTLEYMSPEQASKRFDPHVLTCASDVYSLGAILYELLLGQLPYQKHPGFAVRRFENAPADYSEATRIIREDEPIEPHRLNRAIHPGVEAILLKALHKDPAKRYANAGEFAAAISGHLRGAVRRDMLFAVPVVVAAMAIAYVAGIPALFDWTPVNRWYQRAASWAAPTLEHFQHVVMVAADDTTAVAPFAAHVEDDIGAFSFADRQRPLWAAVCRKLAESGCKVVAFDVLMDPPAKFPADDQEMIGALDALRERRIDCVLGTWDWRDDWGDVSEVVRQPDMLTGAVFLRPAPEAWMIEVALRRKQAVMGSLSLNAVAARLHPGERVEFDFRPDYTIHMKHGPFRGNDPLRDSDTHIAVNRIVPGNHDDVNAHAEDSAGGYTADDSLAILYLPRLATDEVMKAAMIRPDVLLQMDRAELRRRCKDKVVVLANCHSAFTDEFEMAPDGRILPKSYGHALAIETMLQRHPTIRSPGPFIEYAATFLAGALGFGLAYAFPGRRGLALGICATAGVVMFVLSLAAIRLGGPMFNPVVPIGTLVIAAGAAAFLPDALRRLGA